MAFAEGASLSASLVQQHNPALASRLHRRLQRLQGGSSPRFEDRYASCDCRLLQDPPLPPPRRNRIGTLRIHAQLCMSRKRTLGSRAVHIQSGTFHVHAQAYGSDRSARLGP